MITNNKTTRSFPIPWEQVQGAVWMLGLAILAWQGWWWPGILVLVAVSGLVQGYAEIMERRDKDARKAIVQAQERTVALPTECSNCGSPVDKGNVRWQETGTAACSFCGSTLDSSDNAA